MEVYVDADGCPVKDEIYRATAKYGLVVHVVCNAPINTPADPRIRRTVVGRDPDAADDWIAERAGSEDIVVTADIPLADRCLKNGVRVLDPRGRVFSEDSIGEAVAQRNLMEHLRMAGLVGGGPPPFGKKDRSGFIAALHQVIQDLRRAPR